jgi:hypothetical protein
LQEYFHHLAAPLSFPFDAVYYDEMGPATGSADLVSVVGLPHPSHYALDPMTGLL